MFYFEDNGIAGIEESLELFSFSAFNSMLLEFIRISELTGPSELIKPSANQYTITYVYNTT